MPIVEVIVAVVVVFWGVGGGRGGRRFATLSIPRGVFRREKIRVGGQRGRNSSVD